jgi:hypothetical protein
MSDFAKELQFVTKTENAFHSWRTARDEVAQAARVNEQLERDASNYETRTGFAMPSALKADIRRDLANQERVKAEKTQADALDRLHAAKTTIATVRKADEILRPTWQAMVGKVDDRHVDERRTAETIELQTAQTQIQQAGIRPLLAKYLASDDDRDRAFVIAIEEAMELQTPKFFGSHLERADAEAIRELTKAIAARKRARWAKWTLEADERLSKCMTATDDALLRLKSMKVIG